MEYTFPGEQNLFLKSKNLLEQLANTLQSKKLLHAEHGQIEAIIQRDGFEILRVLFQGHLDQRTKHEPDVAFSSTDAKGYKRENCERQLQSVFGTVVVKRKGYSREGQDSLFPQDAELNLSKDCYSDGLRAKSAGLVSDLSFAKTTENMLKFTASTIPPRQLENVTRNLSEDFEAFYRSRKRGPSQKKGILVLSCDAKGIVMRQKDLRSATQKAAAAECHKKKTRLSRGEKRNRKRMAMVAAVYEIEPHARTAGSIMERDDNVDAPPKPENKRVWASVEKDAKDVIKEMFAEALRRDPQQNLNWVILVDGQKAQLHMVREEIRRLGVQATIVLDLVHVFEYLWKAAYCFHKEESQEAEAWVKERALKVLEGRASGVAAGISRSGTLRRLSKAKRENADGCVKYLLKKKAYLKYDVYLKNGFPIATGVIEGACRYLVKDRMDITGARWSMKGAEALLKIRALITSGDFDEYFIFHKRQEQKRNYPLFASVTYKKAA